MIDLANIVKRLVAEPEFPVFPGDEGRTGNAEPIGKKDFSRISRVSRSDQEIYPENQNSEPDCDAEARNEGAGARARRVLQEEREIREKREKIEKSTLYFSRSENGKRENGKSLSCQQLTPHQPPPDDVRHRGAPLLAIGTGLPAWRAALAALSPRTEPCPGMRSHTWPALHAAAVEFVERYGDRAQAMGWTDLDLFGVHHRVGARRADCCGALMIGTGRPAAEIHPDHIRFRDGLAFRRMPFPKEAVPVWRFGDAP